MKSNSIILIKKSICKLLFFILSILIIMNIFNYLLLDKDPFLSLTQRTINKTNEIEYIYSSKNVNKIRFIFQYNKGKDILGTYNLCNNFDIKNLNIFKVLNKLTGYDKDRGKINLSLDNNENCIYLDCYSEINATKPQIVSKINLLEGISFDDYNIHYNIENNYKNNKIFLMDGTCLADNSKIKVYITYE